MRFKEFEGEWEKWILNDLGDFVGGGTPTSSNSHFWDGNIPWVSSSDLNERDIHTLRIRRFITQDAIDNSATKLCIAPVILIVSRVGVGKVAYSTESVCTSQDFTNIVNIRCNGLFLSYLLSIKMRKQACNTQGTSIKGISTGDIKKIQLFTPTAKEQQKISSLLALIDKRISTQSKIIEELETLGKKLRKMLLTQQLRFREANGKNFDIWEKKKLGDLFEILMCKRVFSEQTSSVGEIPFYKIGTLGGVPDAFISRELFNSYKSNYNYPKIGEILLTCSGTVGKCIPFDGHDSYFQDSNIIWFDNPTIEVSNSFLYYFMLSVDWSKLNSTTITRIYGADLRGLEIRYPKNKNEQIQISNFLLCLDKKIKIECSMLNKYEHQKQYLLQNMFI